MGSVIAKIAFKQLKLQLFHVPCTFFVLSSLVRKWKQLCKYFHVGVEPLHLLKCKGPICFLTMPHPRAGQFSKCPTMENEK